MLDTNSAVYQVPDDIFPRPGFEQWYSRGDSKLKFNFNADPFEFSVSRKESGEVIFDTTGEKLVRGHKGPHGVFLLNSNGMDIYIDNQGGQPLEYNIIGGVLDFYFMARPSPKDVAVQYSEITQLPLMIPYWVLGFHQCKYGYRYVYQVAEVVANYSAADIPLETMWTDIDYMELRRIFALDPERFSPNLMTDLIDAIHSRDQHYIVMADPAVWSAGPNTALDRALTTTHS